MSKRTTYYCDFCGKEIEESTPCTFRVVCELDTASDSNGLVKTFAVEVKLDSGNGDKHACKDCIITLMC